MNIIDRVKSVFVGSGKKGLDISKGTFIPLSDEEVRNLASATLVPYKGQLKSNPQYNDWTLYKAVKEGYKENGWVYRSIFLLSKAISSVNWCVKDEGGKGNILEDHHLTILFENPNPYISRQRLFEYISCWLLLAGNSYLYKNRISNNGDNREINNGKKTKELWPISPDRIAPVNANKVDEWIKGYSLDKDKNITYEPEEIIHHMLIDPANPYLGISPLQAAGKTVDIDNDQRDFNKNTAQNNGVIDGVFVFERPFGTPAEAGRVADSLEERFKKSKAKKFAVLGGKATYERTALTPQEMDYTQSRRENRNEIFVIFGVPPQYAGAQEHSTYNNYSTSELIFWAGTVIPYIEDIADTFNFSMSDELQDGERIVPKLSEVPAVRKMLQERSKSAKDLSAAGIPMMQINRILNLELEEYDGWDKPYKANQRESSDKQEDD
jgi:HK97 family phage portal protein